MTMTPTAHSTLLDRGAWMTHHAVLFGDREWSPGTVLPVCLIKKKGGVTVGFPDINDADGIWNHIARNASTEQVYVAVAGYSQDEIKQGSRGGASDVVGHSTLWLDIDGDWGIHKEGRLPSRSQVNAIIKALPVDPTLIVETGGGVHVYIALDEIVSPTEDSTKQILARFKAWFTQQGVEHDVKLDLMVVADQARILRPAGSLNHKFDPPRRVTIEHCDRMAVTSIAELEVLLPELPSKATKTIPASATTSGPDDRPGTRFAHSVPVSQILTEVFGFEVLNSTPKGFSLGHALDARPASEAGRVEVYVDKACVRPESATVFSETFAGAWSTDLPKNLDSFGFVAHVLVGGDPDVRFSTAAKILAAYPDMNGDYSDLLGALKELVVINDDLTVNSTALLEGVKLVTQSSVPTLIDLIESGTPGIIPVGDNHFVHYSPGTKEHGTWINHWVPKVDDEGQVIEGEWVPKAIKICDYIVWRPRVTVEMGTAADGRISPTSNDPLKSKKYDVEIVDRSGIRTCTANFDALDSTRPDKVVDGVDAGVEVPTKAGHVPALANVIRVLGHHDSQVKDHSYTAAGWTYVASGELVFLAPAGSMTARGITNEFAIESTPGSQADALTTAQKALGFDRLPETTTRRREIAPAISTMIASCPNDPQNGIAVLGNMFAAPLHMSRRTTVAVVAVPGSGKSLFIDCTQAFVAGTSIGASEFPLEIAGATVSGALATAAWYRDACMMADDFRMDPADVDKNKIAVAVFGKLVQGNYAAGAAVKATQAGGARRTPVIQSTGVFACETLPAQSALVQRAVVLTIDSDTFPVERPAPVDTFIQGFGRNGNARELMADYHQWLAVRIEGLNGGLMALRAEADQAKIDVFANRIVAKRSAENVAVLAAGWYYARLWATERGFVELLPSQDALDAAFTRLIEDNEIAHSAANPGAAIVAKLTEMIQGGLGHIVDHSGNQPDSAYCLGLGWQRDPRSMNGSMVPLGSLIGYISRDNNTILVTAAAVQDARFRANLNGLKKEQIVESMAPFVIPTSKAGEKPPVTLGLSIRPRGYAIPVETLDLIVDKTGEAKSLEAQRTEDQALLTSPHPDLKTPGAERPRELTKPGTTPVDHDIDYNDDFAA